MDTRPTPPSLGSWLLLLGLLAALHPAISPGIALGAGLALALTLGHGHRGLVRRWTPRLLAISVAALGADLDLGRVLHAGLKLRFLEEPWREPPVIEALFQGTLEPVSMQPQIQWLPGLF